MACALGVDVRAFVPAVPEATLRGPDRRGPGRHGGAAVAAGPRGQALPTFAGLTDAVVVDATRPPEQVADEIVAACGK